MPEQIEIKFKSVDEVDKRIDTINEQLRILEKQQKELDHSVARLEAEKKLLRLTKQIMLDQVEFVD